MVFHLLCGDIMCRPGRSYTKGKQNEKFRIFFKIRLDKRKGYDIIKTQTIIITEKEIIHYG
ncbi:MAG TPA: hypothetical protein DCP22_04665 [Ruminococcaceae bacterium]|nr:hypothetical protein [Oscillospiraceae bacterium]